MFSMTLCFRLDQPSTYYDGAHGPARQQPTLYQAIDVQVDGFEHEQCEHHEYAAAESDEHVVDEELAGEPYEVHAPFAGAPVASGVHEAHDQPQRDWQVQHRQPQGVAVGREREDVCEDSCRDEWQQKPKVAGRQESALPGEVPGEQRQHKEAEIAAIKLHV